MKIVLAMAVMAILAGCKTTGDIRSRTMLQQSASTKSVPEIAGCLALRAAPGQGVEIGTQALRNGMSVSQSQRVAGIKSVVSVWDVEDLGTQRRVTFYVAYHTDKPVGPISGLAASCV